ncbi:MAG: hypothetical protein EHM78_02545 [Myxococcaceae bacterium]|nr:MAG: hypothetical protein EHM78_02545 [Myxococcaceae bacterium]
MRLLGFMGALLLIGAVGWWATGTPATRTGVVASVLASAVVLVGKSIAVRRSIQVALGVSVAGLVLRVAAWFVGYRWVRAQHEDVGAYTLAFFGVFVVALCLEMTYVLVVARGQRRGAT